MLVDNEICKQHNITMPETIPPKDPDKDWEDFEEEMEMTVRIFRSSEANHSNIPSIADLESFCRL